MTTIISRALPLLALLLLCSCKPAGAPPEPASTPPAASTPSPSAGTPTAPDKVSEMPVLEVQTFDGKAWSLAEHRGKWVVVNFWATWCTPCLKELPELDAFDREREDVEVIGLAYEEIERPEMEAFLKAHPVGYPIALVDVYEGLPDFPIPKGLPLTYLIAPDGKVAKQFLGPVSMPELAAMVRNAGKQAPAP